MRLDAEGGEERHRVARPRAAASLSREPRRRPLYLLAEANQEVIHLKSKRAQVIEKQPSHFEVGKRGSPADKATASPPQPRTSPQRLRGMHASRALRVCSGCFAFAGSAHPSWREMRCTCVSTETPATMPWAV